MSTASNPFLIDGPAVISFSGGRTSGYMLRRILDAGLQPDCHVLFANTGKERPETLAFVREVSARWGVEIHWLEYGRGEIDPATASTNGEPFEAMIRDRKYLPNPVTRICTAHLKIEVKNEWMLARGYAEWSNAIGLRADEPSRVAKMLSPDRKGADTEETLCPLAASGVTVVDVADFWKQQPFDLGLDPGEGNCDLCFLKGVAIRKTLMRRWPGSADWWAAQEAERGARFRYDTHDYAALQDGVDRSPLLFGYGGTTPAEEPADPTDLGDCVCHD